MTVHRVGPSVNGPRDLPELRSWLVSNYRSDRPLARAVAARSGAVSAERADDDVVWLNRVVSEAALWWVEDEACAVAGEAAASWPDDHRLELADVPVPYGLAVFASNLSGTDSRDPDHAVTVSALAWGPITCVIPPDRALRAIGIASFGRVRLEDGMEGAVLQRTAPLLGLVTQAVSETLARVNEAANVALTLEGDLYAYLGRTDWPLGMGAAEAVGPEDETARRSMAEDRRLVATLWQIARTPAVTVTRTLAADRPARRRAQRAGHASPEVVVLSMRGAPTEAGNGAHGERHYRVRWVVSPHFRRQPYGPGRSLRRTILIGPYVKGPEGAPLTGRERVWRVQSPKAES